MNGPSASPPHPKATVQGGQCCMGGAAFAAKAPMGWGTRRAHPARWGIGKWGGKWADGGALLPCQKGALALAPSAEPTG